MWRNAKLCTIVKIPKLSPASHQYDPCSNSELCVICAFIVCEFIVCFDLHSSPSQNATLRNLIFIWHSTRNVCVKCMIYVIYQHQDI